MTCGELVTSIISFLTLVIAFLGIGTWRRQLTRSSDYESAKKILSALHSVEFEFNQLKKPILKPAIDHSFDFGLNGLVFLNHSETIEERLITHFEKYKDNFSSSLQVLVKDIEISPFVFGSIITLTDPIFDIGIKILSNINYYIKELQKGKKINLEGLSPSDSVNSIILNAKFIEPFQEACSIIRDFLKPHILHKKISRRSWNSIIKRSSDFKIEKEIVSEVLSSFNNK